MRPPLPASQARQPKQERAHVRFERVLAVATELLLEKAFDGFNMSELAQRLGYTRASIYKFFPTPLAIFNELNQRELAHLETALEQAARALPDDGHWREQVSTLIHTAAEFHNNNPLARLLILGATPGEDNYRSLESTIQRLGALMQNIMQQRGIVLASTPVDHPMLCVEIGTSCLRTSFFLHGSITPPYVDSARMAMLAYLDALMPTTRGK